MITVAEQLRDRAWDHPDRPFVVDAAGPSATYGEFHTAAMRWAAVYRSLGLDRLDNVVTMVKPSAAAYASWIGMTWAGVIDASCNTAYQGRMLTYLLDQSRARVAVVDASYLDRFVAVADDLHHLETVVVIDDVAVEPHEETAFTVLRADDLLRSVDPAEDLAPPEIRDIAMMIYTSGTTGPSKGVLVPWAQVHESCLGLIPPDNLDRTDAFYSPFPMCHGSGRAALGVMTMCGGRFVLREQFSATHYWDDIIDNGCTTTGLVGAMTTFLWNRPPRPDDAANPLRRAVMMPVVPYYREFEERFGLKLTTCYAMSEIATVFSTGWTITDPASCGTVRDGFEVRLVDDDDFEVPIGEVGQLVVRHRDPWTLFQGYFDMPDKTAEAWRNGWFHTGDAFRVDEEGRFYFVDRVKDAIRRRGENISSFEVEALVNDHPAVLEAAAIPVPSEWGEDEVKVCVVRTDEMLTEARLIDDLTETMPRFMVPRYVEFVDSLPKTDATQRVKKMLLRVDPLNARTWDREAARSESSRT